jgi:D-aminoacyl-tRNA deacylase
MFRKFLIVASKEDDAGINITTQLSQFKSDKYNFYLVDDSMLYNENLDADKINSYDLIIFASKHSSKEGKKSLTVHAPGNWRGADFGGWNEKVSKTSALFNKHLFETLNKTAKEHDLRDYDITMEVTHHGPSINKPCVFIEIGSNILEWKNRKAGFIIAKTIFDAIETFKENEYSEVAIGIGGPHYCPNFNKIQLNSNFALSHIIPNYVFPLNEDMIREAIEKTCEEVDFFLLDWKGIGNKDERKRIIEILDKLYLSYKKTSDIKKD